MILTDCSFEANNKQLNTLETLKSKSSKSDKSCDALSYILRGLNWVSVIVLANSHRYL